MIFEHMNKIQQRLHNAAIVLDADGDEYGFAQLQRDAIDEIEKLRNIDGFVVSEYGSMSCAKKDGFIVSAISLCVSGKQKTHKGLVWVAS